MNPLIRGSAQNASYQISLQSPHYIINSVENSATYLAQYGLLSRAKYPPPSPSIERITYGSRSAPQLLSESRVLMNPFVSASTSDRCVGVHDILKLCVLPDVGCKLRPGRGFRVSLRMEQNVVNFRRKHADEQTK